MPCVTPFVLVPVNVQGNQPASSFQVVSDEEDRQPSLANCSVLRRSAEGAYFSSHGLD